MQLCHVAIANYRMGNSGVSSAGQEVASRQRPAARPLQESARHSGLPLCVPGPSRLHAPQPAMRARCLRVGPVSCEGRWAKFACALLRCCLFDALNAVRIAVRAAERSTPPLSTFAAAPHTRLTSSPDCALMVRKLLWIDFC